jgi:NIPSNAP
MSAYLQVRITLKWGHLEDFNDINREFVPLVEQQGKSKLIASYQAATGEFQHVLDIWEIPDVRDVMDILSGIHHVPEWAPFAERLKKIIVSEETVLCTKTPFSP